MSNEMYYLVTVVGRLSSRSFVYKVADADKELPSDMWDMVRHYQSLVCFPQGKGVVEDHIEKVNIEPVTIWEQGEANRLVPNQ